jgi:hypothetical protein
MKKLLSILLVFSIFIPTIWAYDLTDKDKVIVLRASAAIEKMITRKWENYRVKYVTALQKLELRFQNNPRMQKIIGETANVLSDDTSGLESVFTNADISVNSPVADVPKKEPISEVITPIKNETQNVAVINQVTVRKCYMESGEWQETYSNNTWGSCIPVSCNSWFHKEDTSCVRNQLSCSIENGIWTKSWNGGWSNCNIYQCNSGFEPLNNKCLQKCSSLQHRQWDTCIDSPVVLNILEAKKIAGVTEDNVNIWINAKWVTVYTAKISSLAWNPVILSNFRITTVGTANDYTGGNTSLTLYVNGVAKSTRNVQTTNVSFDGFNAIVSTSASVDVIIKADFSDVTTSGTFGIASISYNAIDNITSMDVPNKPSVSGATFTIVPIK